MNMLAEQYKLHLEERPAFNGLLLDSEMERVSATQRNDTDRAEVMAKRVSVLRRLLAAFPVEG